MEIPEINGGLQLGKASMNGTKSGWWFGTFFYFSIYWE
jgi:hypothetical protein